jgi:membrane protein
VTELSAELERARNNPKKLAEGVVEQVREDDVPFMAASLAYQAFASLVPLLVLLFIAVTVVGDQQLAQRVVGLTEGILPNAAQDLVSNAISGESGVGGASASIVGLVTLLWGSLKIFRGLDKAFSEVYETDEQNSFVDQVRDGLIVLAAVGVGIVGMVGAMAVFGAFGGPLSRILSLVVLVVGLTVVFLPMYRFFPDADLEWADAVPGAVFAAVSWMALQFLFRLYIQFSSKGDSSGIIGAVLLLLLWLYLSGLVLLLAAVVNAVLLGEGEPAPRTDDDSTDDRTDALRDRLHHERSRRQTLEHERARLARRLERAEDTDPAALRRRNRELERWLAWKRRPLLARLLVRLLGGAPPKPELHPTGRATRGGTVESRDRDVGTAGQAGTSPSSGD